MSSESEFKFGLARHRIQFKYASADLASAEIGIEQSKVIRKEWGVSKAQDEKLKKKAQGESN